TVVQFRLAGVVPGEQDARTAGLVEPEPRRFVDPLPLLALARAGVDLVDRGRWLSATRRPPAAETHHHLARLVRQYVGHIGEALVLAPTATVAAVGNVGEQRLLVLAAHVAGKQ